ncbi:MAG: YIP1 family protein [Paracoccaceae bacterium]|nr:YIP1 family protein [Paracoccaceae bacterium]MDG1370543.1 YIP1 family protein [Paracoccaceae bacterium]
MLQELVKSIVDSFVAPRASARRVIDNVTDFQGVAVIFGLSFTLSAIIILLKTAFGAEAAADFNAMGGAFPFIISNLIFSAVAFAFLCGVIYGVGRLFGGVGTPLEIAAAIAWHSLITVVFSPFLSLSSLTSDGGASIMPVFIMLFIAWLLANFTAEVHQFKSVWKVAAVMVGLLFIPAFLMTLAGLSAM